MPSISAEQITALQSNTATVRNICILAHVDHGKTTLSDSLLVSNGIISSKLSGKIRYLDSRPDEQERGITMKSSAISLYFTLLRKKKEASEEAKNEEAACKTVKSQYLINLIDSPGHVDFSSEVSTASRLCDGGLVLIDVVEGVCTQTHTVLRQAWRERVKPILVLNKIDRLITELKLTPIEAYHHLTRVLEQANAVMATFYSEHVMREDAARYTAFKELNKKMNEDDKSQEDADFKWELQHGDDSRLYFSPNAGNVIFASAIHGWAFRLDNFSRLYASKLGVDENALLKCLWGDYYLDPKTKRAIGSKGLKGRNLKPMFVQFILDNLWNVYDTILESGNVEQIEKIVTSLKLKVLPRELKSKDVKSLIQTVMSQWLPLPAAVLLTVIEQIPAPNEAQKVKMPFIFHPKALSKSDLPEVETDLEKAVYSGNNNRDTPMVAFISKMFRVTSDMLVSSRKAPLSLEEMRERRRLAIEARNMSSDHEAKDAATIDKDAMESIQILNADGTISENKPIQEKAQDVNHLIGFARIYSGVIKVGDEIRIMGPKYSNRHPDQHISTAKVSKLYLIMGRELQELDEVPAGNVFGIGGLENIVLKTATITSLNGAKECPSLASINDEATAPIVRVAVEPEDPSEMDQLVHGLELLNKADPCVKIELQDTGEHVIMCAGELHLERCLNDLREEFAKIEINVSPPIVPFKETITTDPAININEKENDEGKEEQIKLPLGVVGASLPNKLCSIQIKCKPLTEDVTKFIESNSGSIAQWVRNKKVAAGKEKTNVPSVNEEEEEFSDEELEDNDTRSFTQVVEEIQTKLHVTKNLWAFGPKRVGPNVLINSLPEDINTISEELNHLSIEENNIESTIIPSWKNYENSINSGFQIATTSGPLCGEPMYGVQFELVNFEINKDAYLQASSLQRSSIAGQLIPLVKEACLEAFLQYSPRLMLAMYSCDLQAPGDVLGKVYSVLSRRKGRILNEEMREGTPFFNIKSLIPVVESFGFADDIRKRTSGAASPQLIFDHYEILDLDPFWIPTTEEELEDLGEKADRENVAKRYMDAVRKRKGMFVEHKIVEFAEKQKTMKNK